MTDGSVWIRLYIPSGRGADDKSGHPTGQNGCKQIICLSGQSFIIVDAAFQDIMIIKNMNLNTPISTLSFFFLLSIYEFLLMNASMHKYNCLYDLFSLVIRVVGSWALTSGHQGDY